MSLRLRLAAGALALPQIGDEERISSTLNNLETADRIRVKPMRGLECDGKAGGSNETEGALLRVLDM